MLQFRDNITKRLTNRGFTLIEVLAAIVVLSFGIVVILRALETSLIAMERSRNTMWGYILIREIFAGTKIDMRRGVEMPSYSAGINEIGPCKNFHWEREIEPVSAFVLNNDKMKISLYRVTIKTWRDNFPAIKYDVTAYVRQLK